MMDLDFALPSGRFYVELKPGETTFVSWKKLLKERKNLLSCDIPSVDQPALPAQISPQTSKEMDFVHPMSRFRSVIERIERLYQGDNSDDELRECVEGDTYDTSDSFIDDTELDEYFSVNILKLKHEGFFVNRGKLEEESGIMASAVSGTNNIRRNKLKKSSMGLQIASKEPPPGKQARVETSGPSVEYSKASKAQKLEGIEMGHRHDEGIDFLKVDAKMLLKHDCRRNEIKQSAGTIKGVKNDKTSLVAAKKVPLTGGRITPSLSALEKAILELESEVTEVCTPAQLAWDIELGRSGGLPRSIKQKLATVARLAIRKGGSTDKLVKRLNMILGHLVHETTLKKTFKMMLELALSAMQKKEIRLDQLKLELTEMIKSRVSQLQEQSSKRFWWDYAIEEKICDLFEQYIEEVHEDKGLRLRELYAELIMLWPKGWMDTMGIKLAVHRAKERRKLHDKSYKARSAKKRQLKSLDDDSASILQMIAKKNPSLWKKARALNILKKESKSVDKHEHVEKKVQREVHKGPLGGCSQVTRT